MARVSTVTNVTLQIQKSNPPQLLLVAEGTVPSLGWSNFVLAAFRYITPPVDGIQDFDFSGDPPSGASNTVVVPVVSQPLLETVDIANYWGRGKPLIGVRVHAALGSLEVRLDSLSPKEAAAPEVVHFLWQPQAPQALGGGLETLIGKSLRVYHTGDPLTKDHRPDRANIELSSHERIVKVWFG